MANAVVARQQNITPGVNAARQRIGVAQREVRQDTELREDCPALPEPRPTKPSLFSHVDR